ncbi:MAG: hypothetical protein ACJ71N_12135 [Terriglobales bacterium]
MGIILWLGWTLKMVHPSLAYKEPILRDVVRNNSASLVLVLSALLVVLLSLADSTLSTEINETALTSAAVCLSWLFWFALRTMITLPVRATASLSKESLLKSLERAVKVGTITFVIYIVGSILIVVNSPLSAHLGGPQGVCLLTLAVVSSCCAFVLFRPGVIKRTLPGYLSKVVPLSLTLMGVEAFWEDTFRGNWLLYSFSSISLAAILACCLGLVAELNAQTDGSRNYSMNMQSP